ncbi:tyrosine-type recombinase/integrase [Cellulosimicrobium sp. ES-005]|uniref:Tyrosine-type recombinase/integrase n=1 Tax=Cellulosimicrobium sp. ES-005 TaxID=3163031 RepID=A0AAU8G3C3_9MICO
MNDAWGLYANEYLTSLRAAGRRPLTVRLHAHYLRLLADHTGDPRTITLQVLERALSRPDWAPETRKSARSVFAGFCRWMHGMGYLEADPSRMLRPVRVPPGQARPIPEAVLERALGLADERERLILLLGAHGGLRAGEIATVHTRDLVDDVLYVTGKGGKTRLVPLVDDELVHAIRRARGWLFPGRTDGHLSAGHVSVLMSRLLPDHWTAHTLRHRAGTRAYAGTRDLLAVGAFLGHSKPETTQRYVQLPQDALRAVARAAAA